MEGINQWFLKFTRVVVLAVQMLDPEGPVIAHVWKGLWRKSWCPFGSIELSVGLNNNIVVFFLNIDISEPDHLEDINGIAIFEKFHEHAYKLI